MTDSRTRQLHKQADLLLNTNRLAEARALYDQICALDSGDAEAFMMRGALDGEMGRVEDALQSLNEAIRLDPGYADAYHTLAHLLQHQGKLAEARDALQKAVEIDPDFTEAWAMLGGLLGKLKAYPEAETASRRALELDSGLADARANLASVLVEQGRYEDAVPELQQLVEQQPANTQAWSRLGAILARLERFDDAIPALETSLRLNPSDNQTRTTLGYAYNGIKAFDRATEQLHRVIESNPDEAQAWAALARITEGDGWQALADYCDQLAERFSGNRHITLNHGYALEMLNNPGGAATKYEQLTLAFPAWGEGWNRLGLLHTRLEQGQEASNCLKKAIECGVESPLTLCMYGAALRVCGSLKEAEHYCRLAMEKAPDMVLAYIHLGLTQTEMGELDLALETYQKGLELDPTNATLVSGISDVHARQANPEKGAGNT
jgi:tetratricopeptide (TPR) repeat protein